MTRRRVAWASMVCLARQHRRGAGGDRRDDRRARERLHGQCATDRLAGARRGDAAERSTATVGGAGGERSMSSAAVRELREHRTGCDRRKRRRQHLQLRAASGDLCSERGAGGAVAHVGAQATTAQRPPIAIGDRALHLLTGHRTPLGQLGERLARFEDRLLARARRGFERDGDLRVREAAQLVHDERGALALGQVLQVGDELRQARTRLGLVLR
ncbi:MAG TPA: hypothetical protein VHS26_05955 [Solirubrobacteraceae bacterium]|nr:hypothetical protein [Solirubrobacteraceae bacterium]